MTSASSHPRSLPTLWLLLWTAWGCGSAPALGPGVPASLSDGAVRIGVLTDRSGAFADVSGNGSVVAVELAIEDFGGQVLGRPIELVAGDHQNKPDVAVNLARDWYDTRGVDVILDLTNSAVALAVTNLAKEKNRVAMVSGSSSTRLSTDSCTPNSVQYVYDANSVANVTGKALIAQGADTWFFVTVDFAFGQSLERATSEVVKAAGGRVLGSVRHPLESSDFSSYLLQAQASGAKVVALANAGADTVNAIKTANEFGLAPRQRVASLVSTIGEVHSLGLAAAQGILLTEAFYWDVDEESRAWSKRYFARMNKMPTMYQVGMYSAALTYLKAVQATGTDEAGAVMARMKASPINDVFVRNGRIRADGLHVHDMYLLQVKAPSESRYPWDDLKVLAKVPAEEAFSPLVPGACPYAR